ncbi:hypothetical protein H4219_000719 [Mycoemilia scoparia]|uniref:HECT-type E3 ubiquitin transferase n=1 Tax=Mycoemilia scoparia TaxID=417184 RepID=A0A9W8A6G9_9FUNG|nr:hypothetical protein H4219_000719 [Mycoemilia scoparia]
MPYRTNPITNEDSYDDSSEIHESNVSFTTEIPPSLDLVDIEPHPIGKEHKHLDRMTMSFEDLQENPHNEATLSEGVLLGSNLKPHFETGISAWTSQSLNSRNTSLLKSKDLREDNKAMDSWYRWVETRAKSSSIQKAAADPVLRETLGRSVNRRWGQNKRPASNITGHDRTQRRQLYKDFCYQLAIGCGNTNCSAAFCHSNKSLKTSRLNREQREMLAYELTERAMLKPGCEGYRPHIKQGSGSKHTYNNTATHSQNAASGENPKTMWHTIIEKVLVGPKASEALASHDGSQKQRPTSAGTATTDSKPTGGSPNNATKAPSMGKCTTDSKILSPSILAGSATANSKKNDGLVNQNNKNAQTDKPLSTTMIQASRRPKSANPTYQLSVSNIPDPQALHLKHRTRKVVSSRISSNRHSFIPEDTFPASTLVSTPNNRICCHDFRCTEELELSSKVLYGDAEFNTGTSTPVAASPFCISSPDSTDQKDDSEDTLSLRRVSSISSATSTDSFSSFVSSDSMYDSDGDPLVGATVLNTDTLEHIDKIYSDVPVDNKYILNTLRTVFSSPRGLASCFKLDSRPEYRPLSSKTLNINVEQTLAFAYTWLKPTDRADFKTKQDSEFSTFITAVTIAIHRLESQPIFNVGPLNAAMLLNSDAYSTMLEDACRTLGLLLLLLSPSIEPKAHKTFTTELRKSKNHPLVRVAVLIGKIILSPQSNDDVQKTSKDLPSYTVALISKRMLWLKRHWINFFSVLPVNVMRNCYEFIVDYAASLARSAYSPMFSERVSAWNLSGSTYPLVPLLELLRLLYEGNEAAISGQSERMPFPGDSGPKSQTQYTLTRKDFTSPKFVSCFRMEEEVERWLRHSRYQTNPEKEVFRVDPLVEANFFTPLIYPFLFPTGIKSQILANEAHSRLKLRYLTAFDRQSEFSQNQRLLHVDTFSEQVVRPSYDALWPYPEAHIDALKASTCPYLVLAVRRSHIVQDTMDLMRNNLHRLRYPFKVRFIAGGEDGVDLGGVQKEFFRILFPKLFSPDTGLFVFADQDMSSTGAQDTNTNSDYRLNTPTQYLWPNGATPQSLADFEIVGALLGIAFVNGITLGEDIAPLAPFLFSQLAADWSGTDDWSVEMLMKQMESTFPSLISGFKQLLEWDETENGGAKVEDVFCQSFEITVYDPLKIAYGRFINIKPQVDVTSNIAETDDDDVDVDEESEMALDPLSSANDCASTTGSSTKGIDVNTHSGYITIPLVHGGHNIDVTASNRKAYVRRYLQFIGDKYVHDIVVALRTGFQRAADGVAYRMLTPEELEIMVCGQSIPIDIDQLEKVVSYEDYKPGDRTVRYFWRALRSMTPVHHRKFLKFVIASDRVPMGGISSMAFVIQRNGPDSSRLPTALTCFGRLLLPAYSSEKKLKRLLITAIENSDGFGLV